MSAESAANTPQPQSSTPNFVVLPPLAEGQTSGPQKSSGSATYSGPDLSGLHPSLQALARNPFVLAGGAVFAGVILTRFMATPSAKKIARELALEAFKHLKPTASGAAGMAGSAVAGSLLEKGIEKFGPQIADYSKKILADLLRKKE